MATGASAPGVADRWGPGGPPVSCGASGPVGDGLPAVLLRRGSALLDQQFWLWGQDIRRADGNALLAFGFERERPPEGAAGSRTYLLDLGGGRSLRLWGFGLFCGDPAVGGVFVSRFRLAPLLMPTAEPPGGVWMPSQLPPRRSPSGADEWAAAWLLTGRVVRWLAAYERWIQSTHGVPDRRASLARRDRAVCPAEEMPVAWTRLGWRTERTARRSGARFAADGRERRQDG